MSTTDSRIAFATGSSAEIRNRLHSHQKLDGKIAVVTGAAMGNGYGGACGLARHGAKVYLTDISPKVHDAAAAMREKGYEAESLVFDVRDGAAAAAAARASAASSHRLVRTGWPLTACNEVAVTKCAAAAVITTLTSAPASRRRRTRSGHLYAAIPPVIPSRMR